MVELKLGPRTIDLPYTVRIKDVTEAAFDELVDEDTRAELIDGVMIVHSPASLHHDDVAGFLRALMRCYAREKDLGIVLGPDSLVHLATGRKFGPDIYFVRQDRLPSPRPKKVFEGAPDLVVEILSPSNREEDVQEKRPAYQEAGVGEIWLVDPDKQEIQIDRRVRRKYPTTTISRGKATSHSLAGFWIDADWLWSDPFPRELACLRKILK
jgi:Uma2 family endonuclease